MNIAHEAPLNYLEAVRAVTDYDYCLVHRLSNLRYFNFFKKSVEAGRRVILDNSLFELGTSFDPEQYLEWIEKLGPTEVIAPDVFNDFQKNLNSLKSFNLIFRKRFPHTKLIGAIHGVSNIELLHSFETAIHYCDKIAIPFGSKAFEGPVLEDLDSELSRMKDDLLYRKSMNRILFIKNDLKKRYDLSVFKKFPLHLLGCHYGMELKLYKYKTSMFPFIETADTSHPVAAALENNYYKENLYYYKPKVKIDEVFEIPYIDSRKDLMVMNIGRFRREFL